MQPHKKIEVKEYIGTHKEKGAGWTSYYARFLTVSEKLQVTHMSENQLHSTFKELTQQVGDKTRRSHIHERTQKLSEMRIFYDALRGIEAERFKTLRETGVSEAAMLQQSKEIADGFLRRVSTTSYAIPQKNYLGVMI